MVEKARCVAREHNAVKTPNHTPSQQQLPVRTWFSLKRVLIRYSFPPYKKKQDSQLCNAMTTFSTNNPHHPYVNIHPTTVLCRNTVAAYTCHHSKNHTYICQQINMEHSPKRFTFVCDTAANTMQLPYFFDQTSWLPSILLFLLCGYYSRVEFISLESLDTSTKAG